MDGGTQSIIKGKMSKGILFYAFNNELTDYEKIARWNAKRVEKYLGLPSTIITNRDADPISGGMRTMHPGKDKLKSTWYNAARYNAYKDSPYDETIILDVDYIVNSDQLLQLFELDMDFAVHQSVYDVTARNDFYYHQTFGKVKFPHAWATVCYFKKSIEAETIFKFVKMIKQNYSFYADLYKFPKAPFRNDFAFSIALMAWQGHIITNRFRIPWPMFMSTTNVDVAVDDNVIDLKYEKRNKAMRMKIQDQDLHVLNKHTLGALVGT